MSAASYFRSLYVSWCSPEKSYRPLLRRVAECKPQRIVELGMGDGSRALALLKIAGQHHAAPVEYCGMDGFELHAGPLSLKGAHAQLVVTGAKVRLLPGDPVASLVRNANFLSATDLLICDESIQPDEWAGVQAYLPRMLAANALVARFEAKDGKPVLRWEEPLAAGSYSRIAA